MSTTKHTKRDRRSFLVQGLAATGGLFAGAIAPGVAAAAPVAADLQRSEAGDAAKPSYQETPHIREYYAKARG